MTPEFTYDSAIAYLRAQKVHVDALLSVGPSMPEGFNMEKAMIDIAKAIKNLSEKKEAS